MFTTLASVKEFLGLGLTNIADDALLTRLIADATAFMQSWLSRDIMSKSYTQKLNGNGSAELVVGNYPVTAISSLKIDGVAISASASFGALGYGFDENTIYLIGGLAFNSGKRNIEVTYTAGYAVVPADLEQVAVDMVTTKYRERDRIGLDSKGLAGETTVYSTRDMPNRAKTLLSQYRKVDLA